MSNDWILFNNKYWPIFLTNVACFPPDGLQSRLGQHKIIVPTLVNQHGEFISYDIINSRKRTRRDVNNSNQTIVQNQHTNIHYKLPLLDSTGAATADMHLNLSLNTKLVSRNYIVEYLNSTGVSHRHRAFDDCHYHGHVVGHHRSRIALSNCNGLVSIQFYSFLLSMLVRSVLEKAHLWADELSKVSSHCVVVKSHSWIWSTEAIPWMHICIGTLNSFNSDGQSV